MLYRRVDYSIYLQLLFLQIIPRELQSFYEVWDLQKVITVSYGGKYWKMKGTNTGFCCRFGDGWNNFIKENSLSEGTTLYFKYIISVEILFEVTQ